MTEEILKKLDESIVRLERESKDYRTFAMPYQEALMYQKALRVAVSFIALVSSWRPEGTKQAEPVINEIANIVNRKNAGYNEKTL